MGGKNKKVEQNIGCQFPSTENPRAFASACLARRGTASQGDGIDIFANNLRTCGSAPGRGLRGCHRPIGEGGRAWLHREFFLGISPGFLGILPEGLTSLGCACVRRRYDSASLSPMFIFNIHIFWQFLIKTSCHKANFRGIYALLWLILHSAD